MLPRLATSQLLPLHQQRKKKKRRSNLFFLNEKALFGAPFLLFTPCRLPVPLTRPIIENPQGAHMLGTFRSSLSVLSMLALALAGCAVTSPGSSDSERISALPTVVHPADNPGTAAKIALGKQLFVDKRLSGSGNMACQSCHFRELGWTDAKQFSKRDNGDTNARHTPSLYNVGYQTLWYWDGRATTLDAQILAAWRNQMSVDPAKAAASIAAVPGYQSQFQSVFGAGPTAASIAQALAAYLRSKNSDDSPWDRYEKGEKSAVSQAAIDGFTLFMGKGRCATCHTPPFYGNSTFYNIGLEAGKAKPDPGRFTVSKDEADTGAFKTPTLRSVALGAPYFHDGSVATLEEAVRYMANGGGNDPKKSPLLSPTGLSQAEIGSVVEFLKALTSTERWDPPKLP
jgi:cytochrome c peroxidase